MAKKDVKLDVNVDESTVEKQKNVPDNKKAPKASKSNSAKNNKKSRNGQPNFFQKIGKSFREVISELKKVDWPSMKRSKNNPGALANTGTVIVVVLIFLVVMTVFDFGLLALLKLLIGVGV